MERQSFLEEGEIIIERVRKHWIVYVQDAITHTFSCMVFLVAAHYLEKYGGIYGTYGAMIFVFIMLLFWISFFYAWTQNYFDVWYITDQHIVAINQKKILEREEASMAWGRIQDVSFDKAGLLQTWLGYGKLRVQSAGIEQEFTLENVHHVEMFAHKIMEMRDTVQTRQV